MARSVLPRRHRHNLIIDCASCWPLSPFAFERRQGDQEFGHGYFASPSVRSPRISNHSYHRNRTSLCGPLFDFKFDSWRQRFEHFYYVLNQQTGCLQILQRECGKWFGRAMPVCNFYRKVFFVAVACIPDGYLEIAEPSPIDWMDCHFKLL